MHSKFERSNKNLPLSLPVRIPYIARPLQNVRRLTTSFLPLPISRSRSRMQNAEFADRIDRIAPQPMPWAPLFRDLDGTKVAMLQDLHGPQRRAERDTQMLRARDPAAPLITISQGWAFRTACWWLALCVAGRCSGD